MKSHYNKRSRYRRQPRIDVQPPPPAAAPPQPTSSTSTSTLPSTSPGPSTSPLPTPSPLRSPSPLTDIFIRNVHPSTTPTSLLGLFAPFTPTSLRIIHTRSHPRYSREIAYLSFPSPSVASSALAQLNGAYLDGRFLLLSPSVRHADVRDWLFPWVEEGGRRRAMQLDAVAEYSVTDARTADSLSTLLLHFLPPSATVTDACACVGGNTLSFARHFAHVQACELDHVRFTMLNTNLALTGVAPSVSTLLGSYLTSLHVLRQDAVFIDPPFGGRDYELYDCTHPTLDTLSMGSLASLLFHQSRPTRIVLLKLPRNVDWRRLLRDLAQGGWGEGLVGVAKVHYPKLIAMLLDREVGVGEGEGGGGVEGFRERVATAQVGGVRQGIRRFVWREEGWGKLEERKGEGEEGWEGEVDGRDLWEDVSDWTGVEVAVREEVDSVDPHVPFTPVAFAQVAVQQPRGKKVEKGRKGGGKGRKDRAGAAAAVQNPFALLDEDAEATEELSDDEKGGGEGGESTEEASPVGS